ncbi:MAG: cupredoxin domain-containing protein [Candidatus Bipolaricaulota bacterium]|nr:cupredoxin domain-containing protein [Candidatus Bipolaricaulota bacterium]
MRRLKILIVVVALGVGIGALSSSERVLPFLQQADAQQPQGPGFKALAMNIQGRYIWLPSIFVLRAGETVKIVLENHDYETPEGHGFAAPGLLERPLAIPPGQTQEIELRADHEGIYRFFCHFHGEFHLGGQILIVK